MRLILACCLALAFAFAGPVTAQSRAETLADIRQELSLLYAEIQRLNRELSTTGAGTTVTGESYLQRLDSLEAELSRITGMVERLEHRVERVVKDGTNRIGDLEFRLVELEGGDVTKLGEATTLGGPDPNQVNVNDTTNPTTSDTAELAVSEEVDFDKAKAAFDEGNYEAAADAFLAFTEAYPGGPLTAEAQYWRGEALSGMRDWSNAARSYLQAFSSAPDNRIAPDALYKLGISLDKIGQNNDACLTLNEVGIRYPEAEAASLARRDMAALNCAL